jgi:hypothetical protein
MTENKITGQIVVDSEEALNAFRREIASLEQAFKDAGFANADLNLSLTSDSQNADDWNQQGSLTPALAALGYEESASQTSAQTVVDLFVGHKHSSINLLI